jgi:hypothetical protein
VQGLSTARLTIANAGDTNISGALIVDKAE